MSGRKKVRDSLTELIRQVDDQPAGSVSPDTVPSGFGSVDKMLGGGFRRRDLIVLGGDVGSGKSALALGMALRVARSGRPVVVLSGEMDADRLMERALAIEGRSAIDELRNAALTDQKRAGIGSAAIQIRDLPLFIYSLTGQNLDEALAAAWRHEPELLVVDYVQLLPPPELKPTQEEEAASTLRALKGVALERRVACLAVSQLSRSVLERDDHRPRLDDYGGGGAAKQHADIVLSIYREEMYHPGGGVEGATELIVSKNRNGPTGFVDLYFYAKYLRFEDMLDG